MYITYTNVNGYLIPNFPYKSGEQMEQPGKYGFLRRDYLKSHKNSLYQVMLLQDTIGEHLLEVDKVARKAVQSFQDHLVRRKSRIVTVIQ
ncbi:TnpV protein [Blautia sp. MSJ-19]|uniref:TnpV protein n=1 Tax=Blautia sp. MSJ-19 TaxID=2841517 RepID=UPI001C0F3606|nr:TnpV protein [Blautia sp. MSJ-19]